MKVIRSLILCGCTGDESSRCAHKSWTNSRCLCPCHYSQEQTDRLISAYVTLNSPSVGLIRKRLPVVQPETAFVAAYRCGHERNFERKPSVSAFLYIQQNPCDTCRNSKEQP